MFVKGKSGNPNGRPKGAKDFFSFDKLYDAVKKVEEKRLQDNLILPKGQQKTVNLLEYIIERAFVEDKVLIAVMNKILPTMPTSAPDDIDFREEELEFIGMPKENTNGRFKKYYN